jgi:DNA-binding XRE family transcriptional regulator
MYGTTVLSWRVQHSRLCSHPCEQLSGTQIFRGVARKVRGRHREVGWSQEEAAHRAGMPTRGWQRVETGRGVSLRTLASVAAVLGIEFGDLFRR